MIGAGGLFFQCVEPWQLKAKDEQSESKSSLRFHSAIVAARTGRRKTEIRWLSLFTTDVPGIGAEDRIPGK